MKVLLAGANSYIGTRLIPVLLEKGHQVICLCRDKCHFEKNNPYADVVTASSGDLLRRQSIDPLPGDIDAACYLVNTFNQTSEFAALGALSAQNFMEAIGQTNCKHVIALSDINNETARLAVETILANDGPALTILNTTMIIGPDSTALQMFDALTANTPILIPKNWIKTRIQPIAAINLLNYLEACLLNEKTYNQKFDVGGSDILTFKHMLLIYIAIFLNSKPNIVTLPFLASQLSSHLLNSLTPVSHTEAQSLIKNLKHDIICRENSIQDILPVQRLTFKESLQLANKTPIAGKIQNTHLLKSN